MIESQLERGGVEPRRRDCKPDGQSVASRPNQMNPFVPAKGFFIYLHDIMEIHLVNVSPKNYSLVSE